MGSTSDGSVYKGELNFDDPLPSYDSRRFKYNRIREVLAKHPDVVVLLCGDVKVAPAMSEKEAVKMAIDSAETVRQRLKDGLPRFDERQIAIGNSIVGKASSDRWVDMQVSVIFQLRKQSETDCALWQR